MFVLGLTGGIASGKTTVAKIFREKGLTVIDCDQLAREVVQVGKPAWQEIRATFGREYFHADGTLDRRALGRKIFSDARARERLNQIIHPRVRERIREQISQAEKRGEKCVVVDIPLLFEAGFENEVDAVLVVYVDAETQACRLKNRDNLSAEEVRERIAAQLPLEEKVRRADYVIDNGKSFSETRCQVEYLLDRLLEKLEKGSGK